MRKQLLSNFGLLLHTYLHIAGSSASPKLILDSEPELLFSGYLCDGNYISSEYIIQSINSAWQGLFNSKTGSGVVSHFEDTRIFGDTSKPLFAGPVPIDHSQHGRDHAENIRVVFDIERKFIGLITIHDTDIRHCREILDTTSIADFNPNLHVILGYKCAHQVYELEYVEKSYIAASSELHEYGLNQPHMFPMLRDRPGSAYHSYMIWPLLIGKKVFANGNTCARDFIAFQHDFGSLGVFHNEDNEDYICPLVWTNITPFHSTLRFLKEHIIAPGNIEKEINCQDQVFKYDYLMYNIKYVIAAHKYRQALNRLVMATANSREPPWR
ncbi:CSEP0387 putative effector protein [Blumeria hordei DH14]|uniref:CSEP0387 putative effector protein n=1 Tax=Blumeria graminis f. sp. hordei (strain DH14) TaxID=546991 RepID=N1JBF4_BLUG1|nr:CSEP0387 putative effector protein [Blumeria hordei DH14]